MREVLPVRSKGRKKAVATLRDPRLVSLCWDFAFLSYPSSGTRCQDQFFSGHSYLGGGRR